MFKSAEVLKKNTTILVHSSSVDSQTLDKVGLGRLYFECVYSLNKRVGEDKKQSFNSSKLNKNTTAFFYA